MCGSEYTHVGCHAADVTGCAADCVVQLDESVDVLNSAGTLLWANPAFELLTGYRFSEIQNCPLTVIEDPDGEHKMALVVSQVSV